MKRLTENQLRQFYLDNKKDAKSSSTGEIYLGAVFLVVSIAMAFSMFLIDSSILPVGGVAFLVVGMFFLIRGALHFDNLTNEIDVNEFK